MVYNYGDSGLVGFTLNNTEYFYIRNAQSDIIGILDSNGTQVVGYTYDTWGKLVAITGTLKDTVGVKNPYRYRGYRYDNETGYYYLQSRYYNPEMGRFINADAIAGSIGELLSHNIFAYCLNSSTTGKDPSGFRPVYTMGEETSAMREASYKAVTKMAAALYKTTFESFSFVGSGAESTASGALDSAGGWIGKRIITTGARIWQPSTWAAGTYVETLSWGVKAGRSVMRSVATVGFCLADVKKSLAKGEEIGALIDISSGIAGAVVGGKIAGVAIFGALAAPELAVFTATVLAGVLIDFGASKAKDYIYRR
ncbi:MAG: RHS repeat-associated core domain-containing protein [Clostridium sp.]|uniref:RHS repeat-associated core domain-containing protein n=1 Tax=Clostridium sp. TaxID=1506 RepID=UPI00303320C5